MARVLQGGSRTHAGASRPRRSTGGTHLQQVAQARHAQEHTAQLIARVCNFLRAGKAGQAGAAVLVAGGGDGGLAICRLVDRDKSFLQHQPNSPLPATYLLQLSDDIFVRAGRSGDGAESHVAAFAQF